MMHFIHRLFSDIHMELVIAPVLAHLGMHHVLVDGGEFISQQLVKHRKQFLVAFHG